MPTLSEHIACEPVPGQKNSTSLGSWGPRWAILSSVSSGRLVLTVGDVCAVQRLRDKSVCMCSSARKMTDRQITRLLLY